MDLEVLQKTQALLANQAEQLQDALNTAVDDEQVETAMEILGRLEQITNRLTKLDRLMKPDELKVQREEEANRRCTKLPQGLPEWRSNATATRAQVRSYLSRLEDAFESESFPEVENGTQRWVNALLKTVVDAEERKFVRQELVTKKLPWNEAKLV